MVKVLKWVLIGCGLFVVLIAFFFFPMEVEVEKEETKPDPEIKSEPDSLIH